MSLKTTGLMISIGAIFTGATALSATTTSISKLETKIKDLETKKVDLKVGSAEYEQANKRVGILNSSLENLKINQTKLKANELKREDFKNSMMDKIALGATIVAPVKLAMDFESNMADVKKVVKFDSQEEAKKLEQDILDMSTRIPIKATGLAEIVASGGQLGIAKDKLLDFTQITAKMSTAFDIAPKEAGKSIAEIMRVYKLGIDEAQLLGDAVNHLADNVGVEAPKVVEVINRIGGTAKIFGISAVEASALSTAFISLGKAPEVASTSINTLLGNLLNADKQGDKFEKALNSIGYSAVDLKEKISKDANDPMIRYYKEIKIKIVTEKHFFEIE